MLRYVLCNHNVGIRWSGIDADPTPTTLSPERFRKGRGLTVDVSSGATTTP